MRKTETIQLDENSKYEEKPVMMVYKQVRKLSSKELVMSMKALWRKHIIGEAILRSEQDMQVRYPIYFRQQVCTYSKFRDQSS